jgi:hypothetical protein
MPAEWMLQGVLVVLLAATLYHAIRLERALGVLKRDRSALEEMVAGFNASTRQAEQGIERLRAAADGAGQQIARQVANGATLKDDLAFLLQRGGQLADRLEAAVRSARTRLPEAMHDYAPPEPRRRPVELPPEKRPELPRARSEAERELLRALRIAP